MLTCGLVVLNYKDFETTRTLLDAIKDFPELDYIAVVDNDSPNESFDVLKKYSSEKITVLQSGRNGGYSFGNNFGVRYLTEHCSPDIIGIANPDVIFDNDFVRRIKHEFELNPDYAVLSGFQLTPEGKFGNVCWEHSERNYDAFYAGLLKELFVSPFLKILRIFTHGGGGYKNYEEARQEYLSRIRNNPEHLNQVWAVCGCLFFIRRKDFEAAGLFDERVFLNYEEDILAYKLEKLGRKEGIINDITFIHAHKSTPVKFTDRIFLATMDKSGITYFCNYETDSKIIKATYPLLLRLAKIKRAAAWLFRRYVIRS